MMLKLSDFITKIAHKILNFITKGQEGNSIKTVFKCKPDFSFRDFVVEKTVEISAAQFEEMLRYPVRNQDFLKENLKTMYQDGNGVYHCLLVTGRDRTFLQELIGDLLCSRPEVADISIEDAHFDVTYYQDFCQEYEKFLITVCSKNLCLANRNKM